MLRHRLPDTEGKVRPLVDARKEGAADPRKQGAQGSER